MTSIMDISNRPAPRATGGAARHSRRQSEPGKQPSRPRQVRITPAPLVEPDFWKRFAVLDRLGSGAFGEVLAVRELATGNDYALKLLTVGIDAETQNEITILRDLSRLCPEIVQYYQYLQVPARGGPSSAGERPMQDAILMELIRGGELFEVIEDGSGVGHPALTWFVLEGLLPELACAHRHGVVHRDIKPENIMLELGENGVKDARLIDFGLSCTQPDSVVQGTRCAGTRISGTPEYLAPEIVEQLARGQHLESLDAAADMYALGASLYVQLTGENFLARDVALTPRNIKRHADAVRKSLDTGDPLLDKVLRALLASDPAARPTADQLMEFIKQQRTA